VALWGSLPCTAGSPRQYVIRRRKTARKRIAAAIDTFLKLIRSFSKVAELVLDLQGDVHFEWPKGCTLWKRPEVRELLDKCGMNVVSFDGCAVDLKSSNGLPIRKPWSVATTSKHMYDALRVLKCPGKACHPEHARCAGQETKKTEEYTDRMTDIIHEAVREEARALLIEKTVPVKDQRVNQDSSASEGHRPRIPDLGLWNAMIIKTLSPKDPLRQSAKAREALEAELADLRTSGTWDEEHPMEFAEAARLHADAHFARIFPIYVN